MCVNLCVNRYRTDMPVNFYIDKRVDRKGDASIRVSITINGARFLSSTGYKVAPSKWDKGKQQVRKGSSSANGISYTTMNTVLIKMKEYFVSYENECLLRRKRVSSSDIKGALAEFFGKNPESGKISSEGQMLSKLMWDFMQKESYQKQWTESTVKKFRTISRHLAEMKPDFSLSDIDRGFLPRFSAHLLGKGLRNTTVAKDVKLLKWFIRWLVKQGYGVDQGCLEAETDLKTVRKKIIFLRWEELMALYHYEVPATGTVVLLTDAQGHCYEKTVATCSGYSKTRDLFVFCCFTGLRYSDAMNLKWSNIEDNAVTVTTIKTSDTLRIQLNKYSAGILDRYRGVGGSGSYVFPHISNQRMNIYLKDVCELCGINELVTQTYYRGNQRVEETFPKWALMGTHAGRRTFICNALMLNIPAEVVMKWTGHSDYSAMKPYIDVTDSAKAREMSKFDEI